jgi:hypothetical protein
MWNSDDFVLTASFACGDTLRSVESRLEFFFVPGQKNNNELARGVTTIRN